MGVDPQEIKASLKLANHPFGADEDHVIADFVNKLVLDELLISSQSDDTAIKPFNPADFAGVVEKPVLDKFKDMQDLLMGKGPIAAWCGALPSNGGNLHEKKFC